MRAAGQGHGRNDAATTDPQPRARLPGLALGLWGPTLQILGVRLGPGSRLGLGRPGAWGPGPQGLGALGLGARVPERLPKVVRRSEKSAVRGLAKAWESAE